MNNQMFLKVGSDFAGKKIVFSLALAAGLLAALPALAATQTPTSPQTGTMWTNNQMPCPMMKTQGGDMMYGQAPCGNIFYQQAMMGYDNNHQQAWLGLMFVVTVALVWVALLLLIAVLWKHLCKYKHD